MLLSNDLTRLYTADGYEITENILTNIATALIAIYRMNIVLQPGQGVGIHTRSYSPYFAGSIDNSIKEQIKSMGI